MMRNFLNFHRRRDFFRVLGAAPFVLGVSADRSTWHKRTFYGCRRVFVASFLFTLTCLPLLNHQFSSGKTKRRRHLDFLTWNTCCSGFDGQVPSPRTGNSSGNFPTSLQELGEPSRRQNAGYNESDGDFRGHLSGGSL